ncbi:substrate-binding periplasmic protein [Salidesulfovibrio onnuriiensis]|uniref:substrate-binding periplasmic protein n=1 Tax=Salidesulfovibrio onnuriiensis TaxID=2583823 RepID=UPI0011C82BE5|nr:transporter substrate-binding domain-containing protein [Salidesulfovibrio onnuriiensis]
MTRIFCAMLLVAILCLPASAGERTLKVVSFESPPYAFTDRDKIKGMLCDVVREGLSRMGLKVRFELVPWKRAVQMVRFGQADAIFYAVCNDERTTFLYYPHEPLVVESTIALKKKGRKIAVDRDFSNAEKLFLGVGRGFYYGPRLEGLLATRRFRKVEEAPGYAINLRKLLAGRIDILLADRVPSAYFIYQQGMGKDIEPVTDDFGEVIVFDSVKSYLAFSRKTTLPEMALQFGKVLLEMRRDGTYTAIEARYTGNGN